MRTCRCRKRCCCSANATGPTGLTGTTGGTGATGPMGSLPIPIAAASLIFQPGVPSGEGHVATWAEVESAIALVQGVIEIFIDDAFAPAIVPATANTEMFGRTTLSALSIIPGTVLRIADGGRLRNIGVIQNGLIISGNPTSTIPLFFNTPGLVTQRGGSIRNEPGATVAMIDIEHPNFIFAMITGASFDNSLVPAVPIVHIGPGNTLTWVLLDAVLFSSLSNTVIEGDPSTSLLFAHDSSVEFVPQILFTGTASEFRIDRAAALLPSQGPTGSRPIITDPAFTGQMYFDTTFGIPIWWNGAIWVNANGAPA